MTGAVEKIELRKRLKKARAQLCAEQVAASSAQTVRHILACDAYRNAECIMGYLAFGKELSVDAVLEQALSEGKKVLVPLVISATEIVPVRLKSMQNFELDCFGIRSVRPPVERVAADEVGLILVPGVAFGKDGSRLGMGAGYYDRFLPKAVHAVRMGIAYDSLMQPTLPRDE